jgi:hypothetical protein
MFSFLKRLLRPASAPEERLARLVGSQPPLMRAEGRLRAELTARLRRHGLGHDLAARLAYAVQVELESLPSTPAVRQLAQLAATQLITSRKHASSDMHWLASAAALRLRYPMHSVLDRSKA